MGSSFSKPARSAVNTATRRQYPQKPSLSATNIQKQTHEPAQDSNTRPAYRIKERVSNSRSDAIDLDSHDPHFSASLRSIGSVIPNPTLSHSSTFNYPKSNPDHPVFPDSANPALLVISSRARITKAAEQEAELFGRQSHEGREFLDVQTICQALLMRDKQGLSIAEIEKSLRLKKGVVEKLGRKGMVGGTGS